MGAFPQLERHLRDTLNHLYDPTHRPAEALYAAMAIDSSQGPAHLHSLLVQAIAALEPPRGTPACAHSRRIYDVLRYRYIEHLGQDETAERMSLSPRHLRRVQDDAIRTLASRLWSRASQGVSADVAMPPDGAPETADRRLHIRQELLALVKNAPDSVADVGETVRAVVSLVEAVALRRCVTLSSQFAEVSLAAALHPVGLRQILVAGITELLRHMTSGTIEITAGRDGALIYITLAASPVEAHASPQSDLLRELLAVQSGTARVWRAGSELVYRIELPCADQVTVLVVDDNADLVHFFRRYTWGTRYRIVPVSGGQRVFEAIQECTPGIIVLDVMLPDTDGWELLVNLHSHPATRSIPVIVCSVIQEEDLALALGAALYLPKPVGRSQFLEALDEVLSRAGRGGLAAHDSIASADRSSDPPQV